MTNVNIGLTSELFSDQFPFHVAFNKAMEIIQSGRTVRRLCHLEVGSKLSRYFVIKNITITMEFDDIFKHKQEVFVLESVDEGLRLRGEMLYLPDVDSIVFLCSLAITDYHSFKHHGLAMSDFAISDPAIDFLFLFQLVHSALSDAREITDKLIKQRSDIEILNQKLREAEALNNMIIIVNDQGVIERANAVALRKLDYSVDELKGKPLKRILETQCKPPYVRELARHEIVMNVEKNYIRKDGVRIPVLFSGSVLRDRRGKLQNIVCAAQDISKLKETQEQLMQAQKLDSIGQLAGGVAHDFNNMLGGILGNLELLKSVVGAEEDKQRCYILAAEKAAKRSADLVQRLLGFARKGKYEKNVLDLNDLLIEGQSVLCCTIDKTIEVKTVLAPKLWMIEGDASQLLQVLVNLGLNARDAMPNGGELVFEIKNLVADKLYCHYHKGLNPGDYVCITVSDVGVGIDPHDIGKIFDPFYTTKEVGKGTGLGLSMVYGIMQNHAGVVTVYSELNKGTVFHLYLPRFSGEHSNQPIQEKTIAMRKVKETLAGKTILVVDDEAIIREIAKKILEKQGAIVKLAENGEEAMVCYKAHMSEIALVILDVVMPVMDGIRVFHALKKINPEVKVIFDSGYAESDKITKLKKTEGVVAFIQKPFIMADFLSLVCRTLLANKSKF